MRAANAALTFRESSLSIMPRRAKKAAAAADVAATTGVRALQSVDLVDLVFDHLQCRDLARVCVAGSLGGEGYVEMLERALRRRLARRDLRGVELPKRMKLTRMVPGRRLA